MPDHARVVIMGGGAVGTSVLFHLAKLGWTDCLLIDRDELASGSTWHAAGNVPNYSTSWNVIKYQRYTSKLYATLGEEVDYPINYHVTGSIRLAHRKERMEEYGHVKSMAKAQGIDFEVIGPNEIKDKYPFIELDDIKGGLWDPFDGDIDPSQLTQAFAKGAKDKGAKVQRFNPVKAIRQKPNGEWELDAKNGIITAEIVVNAAGYRAGEVAAMVGQYLPLVSMQHQYLVTEQIPELSQLKHKLPLLRDPDVSYYLRQEREGLLLGPYEWDCKASWLDGIPEEFSFQLYPDDLDRLEKYIEAAIGRVPILGQVGIQKVINGPIPYSPDGNPYIGPQHGLRNFYNCNTFSFGISQAGGAGKTMAEWIVYGQPEWDLWGFDHRRYTDYADKDYVHHKAVELYQNEYEIGFPVEERAAGRPRKVTSLYDTLKAKGAFFGARGGWERAAYFPRNAKEAEQKLSFHRAEMRWFAPVAEECKAVNERVGIMDLGGFTKYWVSGQGAEAWLDTIICGNLPKLNRVSLGYALTERGTILYTEFTITRVAADRFYLLSAGSALWHDTDWLQAHLPTDGSVKLEEVSAAGSSLVIAGPKSRDLLAKITDADLSNAAFPWPSAKEIAIAGKKVLALRVNYVGELGWELHVPMADLVHVYNAVWKAGEPLGIADFGMYAMESLRLEKGYRSWKQDITHEYTPFDAGLERFVKLEKGDFIGKKALLERHTKGELERFVPLIVDTPTADALTCSIVFDGNTQVGIVGSGGYGHRIGKSIALAYVRKDLSAPGSQLEIEILGQRYKATVAQEPIYDPKNERLRA